MALDLETLRNDILSDLHANGMNVFHAAHRSLDDPMKQVFWDIDEHPDFRAFLAVAKSSGAKIINFHHQALSVEQIDEALDSLEDTSLTREEKRSFEKRLRELREYEGFTCSVELSFSLERKTYVFEVETEWYESLNDILAEIDAATDAEEQEEDDSLGGYFSNN